MYSDENKPEEKTDEPNRSRRQKLGRYYGRKMESAYKRWDSKQTNWERSSSSMKGLMGQFGANLDVPFKSIAMFADK